jgi:hypothetical protein
VDREDELEKQMNFINLFVSWYNHVPLWFIIICIFFKLSTHTTDIVLNILVYHWTELMIH